MMRAIFISALSSLLLIAGCVGEPTRDEPAPIIEGPSRGATRVGTTTPAVAAPSKPAAPAAPKKPEGVTVYAYRPPDTTPPPPPAEPVAVVEGAAEPALEEGAAGSAAAPTPAAAPGGAAVDEVAAADAAAGAAAPATPVAPAAPAAPVAAATATASLAPADMPPAVDALSRHAEQQRQAGDYSGAAATLERALRIDSGQAYLWNRLARVRLEQGNLSMASNLAARSNSLAGGQDAIMRDNFRVIADAKRGIGDVAGAQEAERRARGG